MYRCLSRSIQFAVQRQIGSQATRAKNLSSLPASPAHAVRLRTVTTSTRTRRLSSASTTESSSKEVTSGGSSVANAAETEATTSSGIIEGSNTLNLGRVVRHGRGDAYITLNVGGTDFHTLRSTVNSNAVLADHVARAELNKEMAKGGAIFIDRNPKNFGFILEFLRNKVDMLKYNHTEVESVSLKKFTDMYVRLPQEKDVLRDLYIEASYYRIPELQAVLSRSGPLVKVMDLFTDGNPFDKATKFITTLRNFALLFGAFGGVFSTVLIAAKHDLGNLLVRAGVMSKPDEEQTLLESIGLVAKKSETSDELELGKALKELTK